MADRAQQIKPTARILGFGVAGGLACLSAGTLALVAFKAEGSATFSASDWAAIRFTLTQALVSALISVALAIPVARALARRQFAGRKILVTLLGAPFILPAIVAVLGLLAVFGRAGLISNALAPFGIGPLNIYGFQGVVLAHVFFNLPLATRLILQGWLAIPSEHFRLAAQLEMRTPDIGRFLERPMLRSVLPGVFATVFLLCVASFAVVLAVGGGPKATTVELAIYQAFRFDFDLAKAAELALVQFAICIVAAFFAWRFADRTGSGVGLDRVVERWDGRSFLPRAIDATVLMLTSAFMITPLLMILLRGSGPLFDLPTEVYAAAARSVLVALGSAVLTLFLALLLAKAVAASETRHSRQAGLLEASGYLSIAASPMVIGTGLFILVFPYVDPAIIALPLTAVVNAAMSLPFALRILIPAMRDLEAGYGQLSESLNITGRAYFRFVMWPRIRPSAGFAAGLAAALSMGDLGVVALFADPDAATLPLVLYRLMAAYKMDTASGASLLLLGLSLLMFWGFDRGGRLNAGN